LERQADNFFYRSCLKIGLPPKYLAAINTAVMISVSDALRLELAF
jgi:hypothetical protein